MGVGQEAAAKPNQTATGGEPGKPSDVQAALPSNQNGQSSGEPAKSSQASRPRRPAESLEAGLPVAAAALSTAETAAPVPSVTPAPLEMEE
jgi:hypothetical protein